MSKLQGDKEKCGKAVKKKKKTNHGWQNIMRISVSKSEDSLHKSPHGYLVLIFCPVITLYLMLHLLPFKLWVYLGLVCITH